MMFENTETIEEGNEWAINKKIFFWFFFKNINSEWAIFSMQQKRVPMKYDIDCIRNASSLWPIF